MDFGMINKALDDFHVKTMNQLIFLLLHLSKNIEAGKEAFIF